MTKAVRKTVNIKDLPVPKGFTIVGGSSKKKEMNEKVKGTQRGIGRLPE